MGFLVWLGRILTGDVIGRAFDTIDKKIESETDREKIKGDIIRTYYEHRADWMRSGGFWLMLMFAAPLAFHYASVAVYSVFWCAGCAFPQEWTIAALPPREAEYGAWIVLSIFGVMGVSRLRR